MVHVLNEFNSVIHNILNELRDKAIQNDRGRFRNNMKILGSLAAYEISKKLPFHPVEVNTPLATLSSKELSEPPVLICILRAALPFFNGFLEVFPQSDTGFVGAYRLEGENEVTVEFEYQALPDLEKRTVILVDPMLATGQSLCGVANKILESMQPAHIHIASVVAAPEGIDYLSKSIHTEEYTVWTIAIDQRLNKDSFIVPGLGDAGDLSFGEKK